MAAVRKWTKWTEELEQWLEPFLEAMGRKERRRWAPLYLHGLLSPAPRKNVEQIAACVAPEELQQLHHFVSASPWKVRPVQRVLYQRAQEIVGGAGAVLSIDDTSLVKQGKHSVGVARQYCGELGKRANCQVLVSLTLDRGGVPVPIALKLFLPESWAKDPERCKAAGIPEPERRHRPKWQIALEELDLAWAGGVRFECVTTDAEYGKAAEFRQALSQRGLRYAAGIAPQQGVYPPDVELVWPEPKGRGRRRKHPLPAVASKSAEAYIETLGEEAFEEIAWREGTKGPLQARFVAVRVRVAEGPKVEGKRLPGQEVVWLVCEWRNTGEKKYYVCNHAPNTRLQTLARAIKARWSCEQGHEQMKNQLGLDHLECRSWRALHHHALLNLIACCFLQDLRTRPGEKEGRTAAASAAQRTAPEPLAAGGAAAHPPDPRARVHAPMSHLWPGQPASATGVNVAEPC
jgi:SRSO17 transposase